MYINRINRVKRVLSAKLGTEIPKFGGGDAIVYNADAAEEDSIYQSYLHESGLSDTEDNYKQYKRLLKRYPTQDGRVLADIILNNMTPDGVSLEDVLLGVKDPRRAHSSETAAGYAERLRQMYGTGVEMPTNTSVSNVDPKTLYHSSTPLLKPSTPVDSTPPIIDHRTHYHPGLLLASGVKPVTAIPGAAPVGPNSAVEAATDQNLKVDSEVKALLVKEQALSLASQLGPPKVEVKDLNVSPDALKEASKGMNQVSDLRNEEYQEKEQKDQEKKEKRDKAIASAGAVAGAAFKGIGEAFGAQQAATDSNLTKTADTIYDGVTEQVKKMGPVGKIVGEALGNAAIAGDIIQGMGGGTDQMTTTDKWMDSSFFSWNIGMINGFGGKKADTFAADKDVLESVGSSYGGTSAEIMDAASRSGKKYGLFSSGARKRANRAMAAARAKQNIMADISDEATDQRLAVLSMGELAGLAYSMMTDGGYNQKYTYAAKQGGILEWNPEISLEWEPQIELNWELPEYLQGGNIELQKNLKEELEWNPESSRTIEELIKDAKAQNPRFIQRMSEPLRYIKVNMDDKGGWGHATHMMNHRGKYVFSHILEIDGKLHVFDNEDEAFEYALKTGNILEFKSEAEAKKFAESDKDKNGNYYGYKLGWKDFFDLNPEHGIQEGEIDKFKSGGEISNKNKDIPEIEETTQKNVIPEGALHKNKHHMEHAEGLTKKGIPVIDEDGELQAEIELNEIIFTLEVTKKLEEYYKIFYSEDSTNKEKELAALEAGKLLVYEILENTDDRTGLIESCKLGGSLTLKKSTDNLIEEALEWVPNIIVIEETIKENIKEKPKKENKEKSEKELMKETIKEVLIELLTK